MNIVAIFILAVGLAMDATAVSAAKGIGLPTIRARHIASVSFFFGGFQGLMPLFGWFLGASIGKRVEEWDHWIAFVLLAAIGTKMLWEARSADDPKQPETNQDRFAPKEMTILAIATSIDALAAGVTLPVMKAPLIPSLLTIGVVTAAMSTAGLFAGRRFGHALGKRAEIAGGVILIGLGLKILIEHLVA